MQIDALLKKRKITMPPPRPDVVINCSVHIHRNLKNTLFPNNFSDEEYAEFIKDMSSIQHIIKKTKLVDISSFTETEYNYLIENEIIPVDFFNYKRGLLLYSQNRNFSILINGTDHLLIYVNQPGLCVEEIYKLADKIDNEVNSKYEYSFNAKYGYLVSNINRSGTGLVLNSLVHLPVLTIIKSINDIGKLAEKSGTSIKPFITGNKNNSGALYQINNKYSFGKSEYDIVESLKEFITIIADMEYEARDNYYSDYKDLIDDRIGRSYGILSYAKQLSFSEALEYISNLRLGIILSVIKNISLEEINDLTNKISPYTIMYNNGLIQYDEMLISALRAEQTRDFLKIKGGQLA